MVNRMTRVAGLFHDNLKFAPYATQANSVA